ncbi:MAG: iron-containing alcohol dehydrogenase, partial [Woeseiaceae bacterium]
MHRQRRVDEHAARIATNLGGFQFEGLTGSANLFYSLLTTHGSFGQCVILLLLRHRDAQVTTITNAGENVTEQKPYHPAEVFTHADETPPRVLAAPQRYIQGAGVFNHVGRYVSLLMNLKRAGILASKRGHGAEGAQIASSLKAECVDSVNTQFDGECSLPEIEKHVAALRDENIDGLIAIGGGKVADAGKCIAHRLGVPVVVAATLASSDAPCSALSLVYTPEGTTDHVEFFPQNPEMVVVDTDVVAAAGERYIVAGMGDALATWYEARVCLNNPAARNALGTLPTLASCAMGEICAHTLFEHGEAAADAVAAKINNDSVDKVVEANTLLSGVGFESGGLALAHAIAVA